MGTVNVTLGEDTRLNLILGQQLENAVTSVVFDFSAWQTTYGSGTLALSVQRPGDDQPYAVTMTTSGTNATWSVTNLDTAYKGVGHIQLTYTVGTAIKKSVVYKFTVYESLGANGEYPSPGQTWQQNIEAEIGNLANLPTTDKSSLVASINEIDGDITDVKQDLNNFFVENTATLTPWQQGYIRNNNGTIGEDSTICASAFFIAESNKITISVDSGYVVHKIAEYTEASAPAGFISAQTGLNITTPTTLTVVAGHYYRIQVGKTDSSSLAPSDIGATTFVCANGLSTDKSLDLFNKVADSKAVGDALNSIVPNYDSTSTYSEGEYTRENNKVYKAFASVDTAQSFSDSIFVEESPTVTILDNKQRIDNIEKAFEMPTKRIYSAIIAERNVGVRVANNLNLQKGTEYKFVFKLAKATNTAIYFYFYKEVEGTTQLFVQTIPIGDTEKTFNYTVSNAYNITSGYVSAVGNVTNLAVEVIIEPVGTVLSKIEQITQMPLSTLSAYIKNNLAYKPLGSLEKAYICLVSDDGNALLNTYTIPMILSKGVPCTFALMSASDVMQNQSDIDIVKNAITNGGCSVAQHGEHYWTNYSEIELNAFFDTEKAFFDSVGITLEGAVLPGHYGSDLITALCGGRFGVVRSGYDGHAGGKIIHYNAYTSGARSNLFCLSSYNVTDYSLQANKNAVDYAVVNNKLLIVYWHENSLTDATKAILEEMIDYAKTQDITFCTIGDIANNVL